MPYTQAYERQVAEVDRILAARESPQPLLGTILLVEHPAVITVSRRAEARSHLLATPDMLARAGVEVAETDRGGDITYHGPGQIVCYPILDLNLLNLGLHAYMRLLEQAVIDTCSAYAIPVCREEGATGVWVGDADGTPRSKIAACGVRVRKWISMHGLSLHVAPNMSHYQLIVPCGLVGRAVTTMKLELQDAAPAIADVENTLVAALQTLVLAALAEAQRKRAAAQA
jgi:lipoate-protein ligase B